MSTDRGRTGKTGISPFWCPGRLHPGRCPRVTHPQTSCHHTRQGSGWPPRQWVLSGTTPAVNDNDEDEVKGEDGDKDGDGGLGWEREH